MAESEPEMETGGVLVWKGHGGCNRRPVLLLMETAGGLNSRRDADSRLLRSSAFWEKRKVDSVDVDFQPGSLR